jgi:hypothetical protein
MTHDLFFAVPICIAVVYIFVRGLILVLHQLTCILIRKIELKVFASENIGAEKTDRS